MMRNNFAHRHVYEDDAPPSGDGGDDSNTGDGGGVEDDPLDEIYTDLGGEG